MCGVLWYLALCVRVYAAICAVIGLVYKGTFALLFTFFSWKICTVVRKKKRSS